MNKFQLKMTEIPSAIFCAISIGLAVAWIVDIAVGLSVLLQAAVVFGLVTISTSIVVYRSINNSRADHRFRRYLEVLTQLNAHETTDAVPHEALPRVPEGNPWYSVGTRIYERIQADSRNLEQTEHLKTGSDVRARRFAGERDKAMGILSALPEPVLAIDNFDELVLSNTSAVELFEIPGEQENRAIQNLVHCEKLVNLMTDTRKHRAQNSRTGDISFVDENGAAHYYRAICRNIYSQTEGDEETNPTGVVAVLNDVGNEKVIQKRNAEFVSSVSHEMKTPLSSIKAYVELLVDGDAEEPETRDEFLDIINGQADRLRRLIENLLNIARIEAGVVQVKKRAQSLSEILEEAFSVVQPSAEQKSIELKNEVSSIYSGVLVDRDMLLQVAINLLSNAIKYTPENGTVVLRSRLEDGEATFEVEDTGVGLTEEDREKVFEKFYRVKKDSKMAPGTGLGLPLAKHITEDVLGGRLTVTSELGKGSTFRATLPRAKELK